MTRGGLHGGERERGEGGFPVGPAEEFVSSNNNKNNSNRKKDNDKKGYEEKRGGRNGNYKRRSAHGARRPLSFLHFFD